MRSLFVWPTFSCLVVKEKPAFCFYFILVSRKVLGLKSTSCLPFFGISCSNSEQRRHTLYCVQVVPWTKDVTPLIIHAMSLRPPKQQRWLRAGAWMSPSPPNSHAHPAVNLSPNSISLQCAMHVSSSLDPQASRQALISLHGWMMRDFFLNSSIFSMSSGTASCTACTTDHNLDQSHESHVSVSLEGESNPNRTLFNAPIRCSKLCASRRRWEECDASVYRTCPL